MYNSFLLRMTLHTETILLPGHRRYTPITTKLLKMLFLSSTVHALTHGTRKRIHSVMTLQTTVCRNEYNITPKLRSFHDMDVKPQLLRYQEMEGLLRSHCVRFIKSDQTSYCNAFNWAEIAKCYGQCSYLN